MINVCLVGAAGRMGRLLATAIAESSDFRVVSLVDRESALETVEAPAEAIRTADLLAAVSRAELVLDFSDPSISLDVLSACNEKKCPLLMGTTGHDSATLATLCTSPCSAAFLVAPNTSVGVYAMGELVRTAKRLLGEPFDVEVFELHHRGKTDAPSGTAKYLASVNGDIDSIVSRSSGGARESGSIGVASLRGGDVPGEHTVFFLGPAERIEITHRVRDRMVFATGALRLARELVKMPAGRYSVGELLVER